MGIEYHSQPEWLTKTVEISNLAFSIIFAVEMLLKLCALGFFCYISDGFNVFDGVIVILRYVFQFSLFYFYQLYIMWIVTRSILNNDYNFIHTLSNISKRDLEISNTYLLVQSNLAIRDFLVALKLFLNAKSSLSL